MRASNKIELTSEAKYSYKIGVAEIKGLNAALIQVMQPVREALKEHVYWSDLNFDEVEYKSRDGFIAHSHNCGGIELAVQLPKCEEYDFGFVEFGECDGCADDGESCLSDDSKYPEHGGECGYESEGHLDAFLRIRLKFEGISEGKLKFYLFAEGGNQDAPYFRSLPTLFEADFECSSVAGISKASAKHIKKLSKLIGGK